MSDLLATGTAWLSRMLAGSVSRIVVYARGEDQVEVAATIGQTSWDVENGEAGSLTWESRDFIIATAALVLDGEAVTPKRGDRITETVDGEELTYEVMAPGREAVYRREPRGNLVRVHTKLVATV